MPTISIPYTFSPGTTISSSQVNADYTALLTALNGATLDFVNINMTDTRAATTQSWAARVSGDSNARIAMNTSLGLQGGPGNAAMDVQFSRSAADTWLLAKVGGAAAILDMAGSRIIHTSSIVSNGGRAYGITGAPFQDTTSGGVGTFFYGPDGRNNTITLQDTGTNQLTTQIFAQISQSVTLADGMYDFYVKTASSTTISGSTTVWGGINTPPARGTDILGRLTKSGDAGALLVAVFRVVSNLTYDYQGFRRICNLYNPVPKAIGVGPSNIGASGAAYPTAVGGGAEFLAPFANNTGSFLYAGHVVAQHSLANGIAGLGIALNSVVTPINTAQYQAYANNASSSITLPVQVLGAAAGVNTLTGFLGVVAGGGTTTNSNYYTAGIIQT